MKADVRIITESRGEAEHVAKYLETISAEAIRLGKPQRGRKGGYIVRGNLKLEEELDDSPQR